MANAGDVGGAGTQPVAPTQTAGDGAPPTAVPTQPAKVDLTTIPEFREFQAKQDRERAQLAQQLANTQAQVLEMQRRTADADLATLDALDPAEQVVRLKARVQRMDAERAADQERQLYTNQAYQLAAKAGISLEDPRLAGVGSATPQGVMQLASRIAELVREDAEARVQAARVSTVSRAADTQVAAQRAAQDALKDAGVAQTSGQPGSVSAGLADEERAKRIAAFTARKRAMAGKGTDNPAYARLLADVIGAGLKMADLG